jgi:hypothetical protein
LREKWEPDGYGGRYKVYYDTMMLPSGQTIKIEFTEEEGKNNWYYSIYLVTMHKRKAEKDTQLHTTGKDGLTGLLWARQRIIEFENTIKEMHHHKPSIMFCSWDDNRRRNAYYFGLKEYGYRFGVLFNQKVLYKQIN